MKIAKFSALYQNNFGRPSGGINIQKNFFSDIVYPPPGQAFLSNPQGGGKQYFFFGCISILQSFKFFNYQGKSTREHYIQTQLTIAILTPIATQSVSSIKTTHIYHDRIFHQLLLPQDYTCAILKRNYIN